MISKQKFIQITLVSTAIILILISIAGAAPFAYITNYGSSTVSVIDTDGNTLAATVHNIPQAFGVAVAPDGAKVYVTSFNSPGKVYVINTLSNTVLPNPPSPPITVGNDPLGIAVTPDGKKLYVANRASSTVSVIDITNNYAVSTVTDTSNVLQNPYGVAVTPDGKNVYVTNFGGNTVSVIDIYLNTCCWYSDNCRKTLLELQPARMENGYM